MDGHESNHKYKFLKFYEDHKIKEVGISLYTNNLLYPLNVCVSQPKHH